ncbi:MAG TPA: restriction endonuclease subunit S [Bacteroidales bacterium]|jgi:type I restriction enzyme S subunit|nr:restriction endonuclease subunit S [Bacteroidales bacterium]
MEKQKKIPMLRFPEFDGKWEKIKFSNCISLYRGSSPRPINKYITSQSDGINWIKIGDTQLTENYIIKEVSEKITLKGSLKSRFVKKGELILANSMSFGKAYLLELDGCIYDGWFVLRDYEHYFNKGYLLQLLNSSYLQKQYRRLSAGGVVHNISSDIVYSTLLIKPEIPEQQKIASFFTAIDQKISQLKRKKNLLEQYKKGVMQKIFSQEIRFKDDNGQEFPKWEKKKLGMLCKIVGGGTPYTNIMEYWNGEIQWFTPTEIKSNYVSNSERTISELGLKKSSAKKLPVGTILLTTRATIGDCAIAEKECATNQGFQSLIVNPDANNYFLLNWLRMYKKELIRRANGSTFLEISKYEIENIPLLSPSFHEQTKIANFLSAIDDKINHTQKQIEKAEVWKKGLMQQMFV